MTPAPCASDVTSGVAVRPDARSRSATAFVLALALLGAACGSASRQRFAMMELAKSQSEGSTSRLDTARGADPGQAPLWFYAALGATATDPSEALRILEQGLAHHPRNPDLLLLRLELLARLGRTDLEEQLRQALGTIPQPPVEAWLRLALARAHLEEGDLDAAEQEILRAGGVSGVQPALLADIWARQALVAESLGQAGRADVAFDRSLDRGPEGRRALTEGVARNPALQAAARSLLRRAVSRHPGHPDLALAQLVDQMVEGDLEGAEEALASMPAPVPGRLAGEVHAVKARLALEQGRYDEGLAILRDRLIRRPGETYALEVLLESWAKRGVPSDRETLQVIQRAWPAPMPPMQRARLQGVLAELQKRLGDGSEPEVEELPLPDVQEVETLDDAPGGAAGDDSDDDAGDDDSSADAA